MAHITQTVCWNKIIICIDCTTISVPVLCPELSYYQIIAVQIVIRLRKNPGWHAAVLSSMYSYWLIFRGIIPVFNQFTGCFSHTAGTVTFMA